MSSTQLLERRRQEFDVWNEVPLVPQLTGMSCWAAAAAMIIGWRDMVCVEPEEVAKGAGRWSEYRVGLHPFDLEEFARTWGLSSEPRLDWSISELRTLLQRYGPVWLGEASPGLHSIVVTGMYGSGEPDGTFVRINDPWPVNRGERYTLPWSQLITNFRNATNIAGVHAQVMHAGGRRGGASGHYQFRQHQVTRRTTNRIPSAQDSDMYQNGDGRHHEDYGATFGSAVAVASAAVAAGRAYLNTASSSPDPLAGHGGSGDNLCIVWNAMPSETTTVDVVIHLHGYSSRDADAQMLRTKVAVAGVDLAGRTRPTVGIIPRGRKLTAAEVQAARNARRSVNPDRYTFDALVRNNGAGLHQLVTFALNHFRKTVLGQTTESGTLGRVIFSAHSGGGKTLNDLLAWRRTNALLNPEEVHVFDALYGDVSNLVAWVRERLAADRALPADQLAERGGGCRVIYGAGTAAGSRLLGQSLPRPGDPLFTAYRAQETPLGHNQIPATYGPTLLRDVRAELASRPNARASGLSWEDAQGSIGESAYNNGSNAYGAPIGLMEHYRSNPPDEIDFGQSWEDGGGSGGLALQQEFESPYVERADTESYALQVQPAWCALRQAAATTARAQEQRWTGLNGVKLLENNPAMLQALRDYWGSVPGANANAAAAQSAANHPDFAWSAAFICFVMQQAGFTAAQGFNFGPAHMHYIVGALRNRERSDQNRPFWLVDSIEIQNEALPEPGDLICMNRQVQRPDGSLVWTTHTFDSIRNRFWNNGNNQNERPSGSSHAALVVGTWQDPATRQRFLETIGGNETQSVRIRRNIALNANGGIANPAANRIFGMIKIIGC